MKKYLTGAALIGVGVYVLMSVAFPALGERVVVPVMIISLAVTCISLVALLVIYTKERNGKQG